MAKLLKKRSSQTFLLTLLLSGCVFLPFVVVDGGYFFYFGDFNVQQVPFYQLAHRAIRSGNIFWNWHTDLGVNFIGSYSFYLLFSPFFWLTLPFPNHVVPMLMAPLLMLKTACAALTAFFYVKRFVKDERYALLGGVLYAFSGYLSYNIFFNHFHEVVVFFPLLLIALEELVENNRRGWFALAVAANCLVNYWFFIGEVMFVILYVFVRMSCGDWPMTLRKFLALSTEAVLGLMLSMFLLLPSLLAIAGNPRVMEDQLISSWGWLMWIYGYNQRLPAIWASFFFPPELPSQPNLFPDMGANWSSMSAYLPLFSLSGVVGFILSKRRHFIKRILLISALMASVPVLNSVFVLFNIAYYARWFYMPVLLMCVATVIMLEDFVYADFMRGLRWTLMITMSIGLAVGLTPITKDGVRKIGLSAYPQRFWGYFIFALLSLLLLTILLSLRERPSFLRLTTGLSGVLGAGMAVALLVMGRYSATSADWLVNTGLKGHEQIHLDESVFSRSDIYAGMDNLGMYWGLPNIQAFHSIIPGALMEFYPAVGIKRDVSSKPPTDYPELRSLLSVRYLFVDERQQDIPLPDFEYYDTAVGYNIYENLNFLPMGLGYDACYDHAGFERLSGPENVKQMLSALLLDEETIARHSDILSVQREIDYFDLRTRSMAGQAEDRRALAADSFEIDRRGFTAHSNLDRPVLMFFSVPYDAGWRATVNGQPARIERVNIGFMAVRLEAGENHIRFDYLAPGLKEGLLVSAIGLVLWAGYLLLCRRLYPDGPGKPPLPEPPESTAETLVSAEDDGHAAFLTEPVDPPPPDHPMTSPKEEGPHAP